MTEVVDAYATLAYKATIKLASLNPKSQGKQYHHNTPCELGRAIDELNVAKKHAVGNRFIDIGCGIGNVMALAEGLGMEVFGIEIDKRTLRYAIYPVVKNSYLSTLFELQSGLIFLNDALKLTSLKGFSIVYSFSPFLDPELEVALERHLKSLMGVGTVYICNFRQDDMDGFKEIDKDVWRKEK